MSKKKRRAPGPQDTPMASNLPNLSGNAGTQAASMLNNSPASEEWNDAYRQLFDKY